MISFLLAKQIGELFLMILMGFLAVKTRLLRTEDSRTLSLVALYLVTPCVIVHAFQVSYTPSLRSGLLLALAAAILVHIVLLLLGRIFEKTLKLNAIEKTSVIYSNSGNLIIPIVTAVLGEQWVIYSAVFIAVQTVFIWTHCRMVMSGERRFDLQKILRNINILTIFLGIFLFMAHITLPPVIDESMRSVGAMIGPICMIVAGMLMANMDFKQVLAFRRMYLVLFLKMLLCPVLLLLLLKFGITLLALPDTKMILLTTLLAVSAPAASTVTQMAQIYGADSEYASAINVTTTLVCILTMPVMVWLYQQ